MADNYIENKMEEHRRGGALRAYRPRLTPKGGKAGELRVKFPPRRVLVTCGSSGIGKAVISGYCQSGCKVAFFSEDSDESMAFAQECGARYIGMSSYMPDELTSRMDALVKAWGDIDIIVHICNPDQESRRVFCRANISTVVAGYMATLRQRNGNRSFGRWIDVIRLDDSGMPYKNDRLVDNMCRSISEYCFTVNTVIYRGISAVDGEDIDSVASHGENKRSPRWYDDTARCCMFLSLPDNDCIDGMELVIGNHLIALAHK